MLNSRQQIIGTGTGSSGTLIYNNNLTNSSCLMALDAGSAHKMQVVVRCRETIKPTPPPPPHHLRNLKLSFLDQFASIGIDPRMLLFYSAQGDVGRFQNTNVLKKSLAGILAEFYPLAGRFRDNQTIDCNDGGVEYIEARVGAPFVLDQLLSSSNAMELEQLYPPNPTATGRLCAVQVTIFEGCGGMVIGVCISHSVGDGSALSKFIVSWAAIARGEKIMSPKFGFADVIPPRDIFINVRNDGTLQKILTPVQKLVTKRFVLGKSEIAVLRANCANQSPTRVQVACALIFKCLISVVRSKSSKPVVLSMPINWRPRMSPPVPPNYVGNFSSSSISREITEPQSFHDLVVQVGKMIRKYDSEYLKKILADDAILLFNNIQQDMQLYMKNEVHFLDMSSFCRFPVYEADFGWGRPIWAFMFVLNHENYFTLNDSRDGEGTEAWLTLVDEDMTKFESEYELLLRDFGASHVRILAKI